MYKRQLTVVGIVLIAVTILFAAVTYRQQAQTSKLQKEEATVVNKGQVTEKERQYSREYKKLYPDRKGRKFSELINQSELLGKDTEDIVTMIGEGDYPDDPDAPIKTPSEFLSKLSCSADAVVVGSVKNKTAHMTEDETFIYTEYEFSVEDVLKDNSTSPIKNNNTIEVTRPGGIIILDNRRIRAEDMSYKPLKNNMKYVLFLRFVPSTEGYIVASDEGDFILENNSFKKLSNRVSPKQLKSGDYPEKLLKDLRSSVSVGCNQNSTGGK